MSCLNCRNHNRSRAEMVYFPIGSPEVVERSAVVKYPQVYLDKKHYGLQCEECGEFVIVLFDKIPNASHFRALFSSMSYSFDLYQKAKDFQIIARDYFDHIYDVPHLSLKNGWKLIIGHYNFKISGQEVELPLITSGYSLSLINMVEDIKFYKSWGEARPDTFIQNFKNLVEDESNSYPYRPDYLKKSVNFI